MRNDMSNEKIVWEVELPEETQLKHREWLENPFPVRVLEIGRVPLTGSWVVVGYENDDSNKIYRIIFPSYFKFDQFKPDFPCFMVVENNKIVFKEIKENDELPENDENDNTPF